jgi:phospholipid-binding lipoprotein MlaA
MPVNYFRVFRIDAVGVKYGLVLAVVLFAAVSQAWGAGRAVNRLTGVQHQSFKGYERVSMAFTLPPDYTAAEENGRTVLSIYIRDTNVIGFYDGVPAKEGPSSIKTISVVRHGSADVKITLELSRIDSYRIFNDTNNTVIVDIYGDGETLPAPPAIHDEALPRGDLPVYPLNGSSSTSCGSGSPFRTSDDNGTADTCGGLNQEAGVPDETISQANEIPSQAAAECSDPFEPINRSVFSFNDWFYLNALKPVSIVYTTMLDDEERMAVRNFFNNLFMPVRFINSVLQLKFDGAAREAARFAVNSTIGFAGFSDVAGSELKIKPSNAETGQTLALYGIGAGPYFVWPFIGPMSLRDSVGFVGDMAMYPVNIFLKLPVSAPLNMHKYVDYYSENLKDYELLKDIALDPYIALRQAYTEKRCKLVNE